MYGEPNSEYGPPRDQIQSNSWGPLPPYPPPPGPVFINMPRPFNHAPHLIADLLTCGFWLPVHLIAWAVHK